MKHKTFTSDLFEQIATIIFRITVALSSLYGVWVLSAALIRGLEPGQGEKIFLGFMSWVLAMLLVILLVDYANRRVVKSEKYQEKLFKHFSETHPYLNDKYLKVAIRHAVRQYYSDWYSTSSYYDYISFEGGEWIIDSNKLRNCIINQSDNCIKSLYREEIKEDLGVMESELEND